VTGGIARADATSSSRWTEVQQFLFDGNTRAVARLELEMKMPNRETVCLIHKARVFGPGLPPSQE